MRLIDRIRLEIKDFPADIPCIVADNIAAQIDQLPSDWDESPDASAFGIVAPPFSRFFIEAQTTAEIIIGHENQGKPLTQTIQRGMLIDVEEAGDDSKEAWHWRYVMTPFAWYQPVGLPTIITDLQTANGCAYLHLDKDGEILDHLDRIQTAVFDRTPLTIDKMRTFVSFLPFILKTLSVLHQKTYVEHVTPTRQMRRMHQRKHKRELSDYYVLSVQPVQHITDMDDVARPVKPAGRRRAHVVRGHFRYYSPERPLFGRYSGMIWIPDHERGKPELGAIRKDYMVDGAVTKAT
jgi:hypothetical protein